MVVLQTEFEKWEGHSWMKSGVQLQLDGPSEEGRVVFVLQQPQERQEQRPQFPGGCFLRIGAVLKGQLRALSPCQRSVTRAGIEQHVPCQNCIPTQALLSSVRGQK